MDVPGTSARIILMNVYSTSRGSRCSTAGSLGYGGPGAGAGGEVSIDYIMPEGGRGGCGHQACGVDRKQGRAAQNGHGNSSQFKRDSSGILPGFYWGRGTPISLYLGGISPPI